MAVGDEGRAGSNVSSPRTSCACCGMETPWGGAAGSTSHVRWDHGKAAAQDHAAGLEESHAGWDACRRRLRESHPRGDSCRMPWWSCAGVVENSHAGWDCCAPRHAHDRMARRRSHGGWDSCALTRDDGRMHRRRSHAGWDSWVDAAQDAGATLPRAAGTQDRPAAGLQNALMGRATRGAGRSVCLRRRASGKLFTLILFLRWQTGLKASAPSAGASCFIPDHASDSRHRARSR